MISATRHVPSQQVASLFDAYAENYDEVLNAALAASGETKEYFASGRLSCLAELLKAYGADVASVLDYGCGTGTSTRLFFDILECRTVLGVDISSGSLEVAARENRILEARFEILDGRQPSADIDLAYSNGVFHHIAPKCRPAALSHIRRSLRERGLFAFCENNPWNPGTRYCMRVNPFDRDAIPISPIAARRLLIRAGFRVLDTRFLFFFPRLLKRLRLVERYLSRVPLGGQYLVLAVKSAQGATLDTCLAGGGGEQRCL